MNKIKFTSLTASLVLATTLTLSCEDKETKDKPAPAAAAVPEKVAAVSESGSKIMYVNDVKGLNMRSEPSTDGVKLGTLFYGTKVQVLEKSSTPVKIGDITDYWYKTEAHAILGGDMGYKHSWVFGGFLSENPPIGGTLTDSRDGKVYRKVKIGKQTWMAENLNFAAEDSKCYDNNPDNCAIYGRLYDWETAKKSCPSGWHLPNDEEWTELMSFLASNKKDVRYDEYEETGDKYYSKAGKYLKSKIGWNGTDEFGFSALPGGYDCSDNDFRDAGRIGRWWWSSISGMKSDQSHSYTGYNMTYDTDIVNLEDPRGLVNPRGCLISVRCIQD